MIDKQTERLMQQEAKFFGIESGFKLMTPGAFGGMNQSASRMMMADQEFFWIENFIRLGDGALRTLWDKGASIYTAPAGKTIIYFYFFNIASNNYAAIFLSDGTAIQVNTSTLANTTISSVANTFYNSSISTQLPVCGQWGSQYLLIANNFSTNNYWIWDGAILYKSGTLGPQVIITNGGSGYSSAPTVTAFGGSGSGATFTASVANGSVVSVITTNPGTGYEPGDNVQLAFSGGGADTSAQLVAQIGSNFIQSVVVTDGGAGYTSAPTIGFTGGGGSGAAATATVSGGVVTAIDITNPGTSYSSTPTVTFSGGGGSGASAVANLTPGSLLDVLINDGGTGYNATPTLTFVGGGGTGAAAVATVTAGVITAVTVTAPGSGYTSPPAVVVQSGINTAASAIAEVMPFGVSGTSIETFQQRVWIGFPHQVTGQINGGTFLVSAPGSFTDFSTADGGLIFVNSDSFLRQQYVNLKQSNGYLYPIGDSSVSVISNVQTSGSPTITTFNYQNTDPQTGTGWRDSVQAYSRTIVFANQFGVFGLYGGSVTKISSKVDNLFTATAGTNYIGTFNPSSGVADVFSKKIYLLLFTTIDPTTQTKRNVLLSWDEKNWFITSQTVDLIFIAAQEINSGLTTYGTDGTNLYPLMSQPSATLTKKLSTKLYGANSPLTQKESVGVYFQAQDQSVGNAGVVLSSVNIDAETGFYPIPKIPVFPSNSSLPYNPIVSAGSGDAFGVNLGLTITTQSPDFVLSFMGLGAIEVSSLAMSSTVIEGQIETQ